MLLALTIWENRISPLFDVAQKLMIVEIDENRIISERIEDFCFKSSVERAHYLKSCQVDVLICGAVSNLPAGMMELSGIRLFPFVTGRVNHIIQSFIRQEFPAASFKMPGCRQRAHRRRGGCFKNEKIEKEVISMPGGDGKGPQGGGKKDGSGRDDAGNSRGNSGGSGKGSGQGGGKGGCQDGKGSGQGGGKGGGQGGGKGGGQGRGR